MIPYLGCTGARPMIESFVDGELSMSDQVRLESHLRWCETCRARVDDMRTIGMALRLTPAAADGESHEATMFAAMQDDVLSRVCAERDDSLSARFREAATDMRYLWPAFGATLALVLCVSAATAVSGIVRTVTPNSMAALISILASPGSDQNPLHFDAAMLAPRPLVVGPPLDAFSDEESVFALAAVVTREGRVANYELLQSESGDLDTLHDVVRHSRFEPAQTTEGAVAANVVWLLTRTTVRGSVKPEIDEPAVSDELARPVLRPARS